MYSLVTSKSFAQKLRSELERNGYADSKYRIKQLLQNKAALPILEKFVQDIIWPQLQKIDHNTVTETDNQKFDLEKMKTLPDDYVFQYAGVDFQLGYFKMDLSKKARVKTPLQKLETNMKILLSEHNKQHPDEERSWSAELRRDLPQSWEKHEDLILLPDGCFTHTIWTEINDLWPSVAASLGGRRLGRKSRVSVDGFRTPHVQILHGDNGWVTHVDNGIKYIYDVTKCMFSSGNVTEKLRVAGFNCSGETVVDLYAGIGYFTLAYLVHSGAAHVHACEWNPDAVTALRSNLELNAVQHKCTVHEGDNRLLQLRDIADRVNLGLIPSSEAGWPMACQLLRKATGGRLHIHTNVDDKLQQTKQSKSVTESVINELQENLFISGKNHKNDKLEENDDKIEENRDNFEENNDNIQQTQQCEFTSSEFKLTSGDDNNIQQNQPNVCTSVNDTHQEYNSDFEFGVGQVKIDKNEELSTTDMGNSFDSDTNECSCTNTASTYSPHIGVKQGAENQGSYSTHTENTIENQPSQNKFKHKQNAQNRNRKFVKNTVVKASWVKWSHDTVSKVTDLLCIAHGGRWEVNIEHIEHVKSYAPHVDHIVLDLYCKPVGEK